MSSTKKPEDLPFAGFFERLVSAVGVGGKTYFASEPDSELATYYVRRKDSGDYITSLDTSKISEHLGALWSDRPELTSLIPDLQSLYESTPPGDGEDGGDVSPFIYEMF